jgi:hypothetical protein
MKRRDEDRSDRNRIPLEKHVEEARRRIREEKEKLPFLKEEVQRMEREARGMVMRYQVRMRKDVEEEIRKKKEEIEDILTCKKERELDARTEPYLKAYRQRFEVEERKGKEDRNIMVPGSKRKKETIDTYVLQKTATINHQTSIVNEYLMETENHPPKLSIKTRDDCPLCKKELMLQSTKSIMTCTSCGYSVTYLDATMQSTSYMDDIGFFSSFSYKRINHFNEWLQQVQGKENYEVPLQILDEVMAELFKQRVTSVSDITQKKVRDVLKTLRLRKAYEHVAQITSRLTGVPPIRVPQEVEETCRMMFISVQPAFEKHCPKDRKNFLSYSYCLYKFFQLLGYDQFLDSFSLLKGKDKLQKQDDIFKLICKELNWEFLPSLVPSAD